MSFPVLNWSQKITCTCPLISLSLWLNTDVSCLEHLMCCRVVCSASPQVCLPFVGLIHAGSLLTLQGAGAYDAAVHCASVSAARRILQQQQNPDGTLPQSMHSIQGQRHYDATQPIPVQVPAPGTPTNSASSGQSSSSTQAVSTGMPRINTSNNRSRKRWTGITRRMRTALCEMWTPNSRPNEGQAKSDKLGRHILPWAEVWPAHHGCYVKGAP